MDWNPSPKKALSVRPRCAAVVRGGDFVVSCNFEPLAGGNDLVIEAVRHSSVEDTHSLHGEEIVGSVRMVVDTAEEGCRRVLADHLDQEVGSSRVLVDERADVMNETGDEDEVAFLGLLLEALPADDG